MVTPAEQKVFVQAECDADLSFLFAENEVSPAIQYRVVHGGYKTLRRFVGFEETRASFRAAAKIAFTIGDAAEDML
jgi:hypothetical protein